MLNARRAWMAEHADCLIWKNKDGKGKAQSKREETMTVATAASTQDNLQRGGYPQEWRQNVCQAELLEIEPEDRSKGTA